VGFGVNDHLIRELINLTKIISREFILDDIIWKGGAQITFLNGNALKEGLNSFYVLKLSIGIPYYQGEHNIWLKLCYQVLKSYSKYPYTSARIVSSTFLTFCCLGGCDSVAPGDCRT
jgi:hypothetical protein